MADFKIPEDLVVVDEFPRTGSGKLRKATLREQLAP
jgi:acyl-CoA synthetase (AMP-forming)/AMP-acid ligase II